MEFIETVLCLLTGLIWAIWLELRGVRKQLSGE